VKQKYESNPDTNAFTDNYKDTLEALPDDVASETYVASEIEIHNTSTTSHADIRTAIAMKQDALIGSGEGQNIKTINNQSIIGSGNIATKTYYDIGDVYFTTTGYSTPEAVAEHFGYGTWTKLADGVLKLGSTANTNISGSTKISREQLPNVNLSHTHTLSGSTNSAGAHNHDFYFYYGGSGNAPAGSGANQTSRKTSTDGAHTHTLSGTATSSNVYLNGNKTQQDFIPAGITVVGWLRTA
jgi:hypothetical protein